MKDYVKPLKNPQNHSILCVGKIDLISNKMSEERATSVINLATSMKGNPVTSVDHQLIQG